MGLLYMEHNSWLKGWLYGRLGCTSQAADLAQGTFLRLDDQNQLDHLGIDPDTQTADAARYSYYERIKTLGLDSFVTAPFHFAGRTHEFTLGGEYQHLDKAFTYGSVDLDGDGYADELPIGIDGANDLPRLNLLGQTGALKRPSLSPVAQSIRPQGPAATVVRQQAVPPGRSAWPVSPIADGERKSHSPRRSS